MKQIVWIVLAFFMLHSCDNEIKLFPDVVPSMYMIYGILDSNDSIQQIKVRKTFGGSDTQNNLAGNSDLFLPAENIRVMVVTGSGSDSISYEFSSTEYDKDVGFFANDRNPVHEAYFKPVKGQYYRLILVDPELSEPITATLKAIGAPLITYPFNGNAYYRFSDVHNPFYFQFTATGQVHLQQFFVNYLEINKDGDTIYTQSRFDLSPKYKDSTQTTRYYGKEFGISYILNIIHMRVIEDEEVMSRVLHSFDYVVWAGDQVMKDYLQLAERFPDNRKMFFSNIENGFGFFAASSHSRIENLYPTQAFFDTLVTCPVTKDLKFQNHKFIGEFRREGR